MSRGKEPIRIAVVGSSGFIGQNHVQHVLMEPDAQLVALVDSAPSTAITAQKHKAHHFEDIKGLLTACGAGSLLVDAVILATPTETHIPLAISMIGWGFAVLIEKPLSTTLQEGRQFLELSKQDPSSIFMVGHHRRHNAYVKAIKQVLTTKKLGRVIAINAVWAVRKDDAYFDIPWHVTSGVGGLILTNAIHDFDMLQYWLGPIVAVFAVEGRRERSEAIESTVQTTLRFASGVVGSYLFTDSSASHLSWEASSGDNSAFAATNEDFLTILGTEGSISLPSLVRYHYDDSPKADRNWKYPLQQDSSASSSIDGISAFTNQLKHFIAVARREQEPNCSVEDALRAVAVADAVFKSLQTGEHTQVERI